MTIETAEEVLRVARLPARVSRTREAAISELSVGQVVRFWVRKRGEKSYLKTAVIKALSEYGSMACVEVTHPPQVIPVQTIETKRLITEGGK